MNGLAVVTVPVLLQLAQGIRIVHTLETKLKSNLLNGSPSAIVDLDQLRVQRKAGSSLPLFNYWNVQFIGPVLIGTPSQKFMAIFDTGSSDMWIPSVNCTVGGCEGHHKFNPQLSATFQLTPETHPPEYIQYGTGSCAVNFGIDDIRLGSLTIRNQTVGLANSESSHPFRDIPLDGIIGLGFSKSGTLINQASLLHTLQRQKLLKRNIFSFHLSKGVKNKGSVSFGTIDSRYLDPKNLQWFPLTSTDHWEVALYGIKIGDTFIEVCAHRKGSNDTRASDELLMYEKGRSVETVDPPKLQDVPRTYCSAAVDTGSSMITLPSEHVAMLKAYMADAFQADLSLPIDCSTKLPPISIVLENIHGDLVEFSLHAKDYLVALDSDENESSDCVFGLIGMDVPRRRHEHSLAVLGIDFLQHYSAVFDFENFAVGLGETLS